MIRNYFKIAWRNLTNSKSFSILNIVGLSTGMACSILILLWVQNELSYDQFHTDSKDIYRFTVDVSGFKAAVSPAGMGPDLQQELPEIESVVRTSKFEQVLFEVNNNVYEEERAMFADANFLVFFDFPLLEGDRKTVLKEPNTILLTETMAKKYFGDQDALGQTILVNNELTVTVAGILKNLPSNSHLNFDFLISMSTIATSNEDIASKTWDNFDFYTYFKLAESTSSSESAIAKLEDKITAIYLERKQLEMFVFHLQPLEDIHLHSDFQLDVAGHGNIQYVNIFFIVALFILLVACINFMNLSTARSDKRSKEVGIRKALGALRGQLIAQFLSESILLSFISLIVAIGLVFLSLPYFNDIAGKALTINIYETRFWLNLLLIVVATGLFSGSYPAFYLSSFNPVKVLKGKLNTQGGNLFFRNSLVTTQFVVSAVLIVGTVVVYNQLSFIKNKNLGFNKTNLISVPFKGEIIEKLEVLKIALEQNPLTENYSITSDLPTNLSTGTTVASWEGKEEGSNVVIPNIGIDENFLEIFEMKMLAGRGFSKDFSADENSFVVNETMMKLMGKDPNSIIGQKLSFQNNEGQVIGLLKDFHFKPLQYDIEPLVLEKKLSNGFLVVRTTMNQTKASLVALESIHAEVNPAFPFEYSFMDEDLESLYLGEEQMGKIFNIFAILAIFLSCLGIYGLSAFTAEQRTKEIGIRKVLGASTIGLVNLLSRDFFKLVILALFIAVPLSSFYLNEWLQGFAFHINISWWIYGLAAISVLVITLLTVSYQSIKAAKANPIDSLRSE